MAVGFPTKVNYLTGDVLTATNMNDLSGTTNLLNGSQYAGGKNRVLNSNYSVWQRGTSVAVTASASVYTADRWYITTGATQALTVARQTTSDTTNLPNIQYCARVQRNSGQTGTSAIQFGNSFESINSIPLAGKTIVFSYYARAGANYSAASSLLGAGVSTGTGTDQQFNVYTGYAGIASANATLTTTWQRFTGTGTVPSTATEIAPVFTFTPVGTAGVNDYFEITGVQIEASTTAASAYTPNGATQQAELAACQRYYYRIYPGVAGYQLGTAATISTTVANVSGRYPVTMRIRPTALEQSGTANQYAVTVSAVATTCSAVPTIQSAITEYDYVVNFTVAAGLVTGQAGRAITDTTNGATAYLGWSAEL